MALLQQFDMQEKLHETLSLIDQERRERMDLMARMEQMLGMGDLPRESLPKESFELVAANPTSQTKEEEEEEYIEQEYVEQELSEQQREPEFVQPEQTPAPLQSEPQHSFGVQNFQVKASQPTTSERTTYTDIADEEATIPESLSIIQNRPTLPPSLSPDGYDRGEAPQMPGHPDIPIEILPFLMLGTSQTASDANLLKAMGITALLSATSDIFEVPLEGLQYLQCTFDDVNTSLSLQRQKAMDMISSTRQMAGRVLVFDNEDLKCCVCMMYLMWECRLTLLQSFALVQYKMPSLKISRRLCKYLVHYEAILHGANSMMLSEDGLLIEATI